MLKTSRNSNFVWSAIDNEVQTYNDKQYQDPYESTKFVIKQLQDMLKDKKDISLLDIGCSAGANLYHMANAFKDVNFAGIDINEHYLNQAIEVHKKLNVSNTEFSLQDFAYLNLESKYDIVGSCQVLEVLDIDKAEIFKSKCFQHAKEGVFFLALFTERLLEYEINIHDHIYEKIVPYSIYSVPLLEQVASEYGFELLKNEEFIINVDLPNVHKGRGTYTKKDDQKRRTMFSDVLYLPWRFLYFKKEA